MTRVRLRLQGDQLDILVSHLRGEVGEIITTWTYFREFLVQIETSTTGDLKKDLQNPALIRLSNLRDRFADEIVAQLSELAQRKAGRTNFHEAHRAFPQLETRIDEYRHFIRKHSLHDRRNKDISHKQLPTQWLEKNAPMSIEYRVILRGIAMALSLMKVIDFLHIGPASDYLWLEMRKKRYTPLHPSRHSYMLLPHFHLPGETRLRIVHHETALGMKVWEAVETSINKKKAHFVVCKRWGIIKLGNQLFALDKYPLIELNDIEFF
jgi:hypothetical protein